MGGTLQVILRVPRSLGEGVQAHPDILLHLVLCHVPHYDPWLDMFQGSDQTAVSPFRD